MEPGVGKVFIPGCMGGAVYGPERCTCNREKSRARLAERVEELESQVRGLLEREKVRNA